jgi:osmotically-inducible protein OsmY
MRDPRLLALLLLVAFLPGCAAVVIGGAATGVAVSEDRRTVGTMTEDQGIEVKAGDRISSRFKDVHVNVTSYNRRVLLTGEAPDAAAKSEIEKIARAVEQVRGVINEIAITGNSSLTARSNDSFITSKVKGRFVDAQKFNPFHVKVVTEAGVAYLLGIVTHKEADAAASIASTTDGVQKVVRVFDYLD